MGFKTWRHDSTVSAHDGVCDRERLTPKAAAFSDVPRPKGGDQAAGIRSCGFLLREQNSEPLENPVEGAVGDELLGELVAPGSHLAADDAVVAEPVLADPIEPW